MYGENGILIDVEEIGKIIEGAEIFVLGFAHMPERLLSTLARTRARWP
jgi:hypothetical protein